jgi:hypothetical protein
MLMVPCGMHSSTLAIRRATTAGDPTGDVTNVKSKGTLCSQIISLPNPRAALTSLPADKPPCLTETMLFTQPHDGAVLYCIEDHACRSLPMQISYDYDDEGSHIECLVDGYSPSVPPCIRCVRSL